MALTKKQEFLKFLDEVIEAAGISEESIPEGALAYIEALRAKDETEKPMFTDNGKTILKFLQENADVKMWKCKDIAGSIGISSRGVSGAIRKLVTDGFVEKMGESPIIYSITEKGKNIELN